MSARGPMLDDLSDDALIALRDVFLRASDRAPTEALVAIAACINEVDDRLARRGRLNLGTGKIT